MKGIILSASLLLVLMNVSISHSECLEYKIIDHGNSVEAVCVGQSLTEYEKRGLEMEADQRDTKVKNAKNTDKAERRNDQTYELYNQKNEISVERNEIALDRDKEHLRRERIKNDALEDKMDDTSKKLNSMIRSGNKIRKLK